MTAGTSDLKFYLLISGALHVVILLAVLFGFRKQTHVVFSTSDISMVTLPNEVKASPRREKATTPARTQSRRLPTRTAPKSRTIQTASPSEKSEPQKIYERTIPGHKDVLKARSTSTRTLPSSSRTRTIEDVSPIREGRASRETISASTSDTPSTQVKRGAVNWQSGSRSRTLLYNPPFADPPNFREINRVVVVIITVNPSGLVTAAELKSSSLSPELDRLIRANAKKYRFKREDQLTQDSRGEIRYTFKDR